MAILLTIYVEKNENLRILSLEGFLGTIGTFIAICTAIMLGAQVYSIYNKSQSEKEYNDKFEEVKSWFVESSESNKDALDKVLKATKNLSLLKYLLNEAMGGIHYNEGKKLEGVIDVIENVYMFTSNESLFVANYGGYEEKLNAACYFIAKNMKEYASDKLVKAPDIKGLIRIQGRWNKRYSQLDKNVESVEFIQERIDILNEIFNRLIDGLVKNNCKYNMPKSDWDVLAKMAID